MAISLARGDKIDGERLSLLLCDGGMLPPARVAVHSHLFWQLEHIGGPGVALLGQGFDPIALHAGDVLLLPPGVLHGFTYTHPVLIGSYKFEMQESPGVTQRRAGGRIRRLAGTSTTGALFAAAASLHARPVPSDRVVRRQLELLLGTLVRQCLLPAAPVVPDSPSLAEQVSDYVDRHRHQDLRVADIAAELGYSTSHVAATFRAARNLSLKAYIDRARVDLAVQQLRYSERSIADIARLVGFADPHSFSRFVRRLTGHAPTWHRRVRRTRPTL